MRHERLHDMALLTPTVRIMRRNTAHIDDVAAVSLNHAWRNVPGQQSDCCDVCVDHCDRVLQVHRHVQHYLPVMVLKPE